MDFKPLYTVEQMLQLGVFDGNYFTDPKLSSLAESKNLFAPAVSLDKQKWIDNGWITPEDPLGWVEWYWNWSNGRQIPTLDRW